MDIVRQSSYTGWDVELKRKLAVPLAIQTIEAHNGNTMSRTRTLRMPQDDPKDFDILSKLAENRMRINQLHTEIDLQPEKVDCLDVMNELDYLKANIELSLLEIGAGIEATPSSDEILFQEAAFV
ncbi:MAG: hypothetical protein E4H25_04975 [Methanomassiliicoccus sp.]|nr:MAG: hypothetical protein E4H25_04975 [Methanomassiliicoccus sp.]